MEQFTPTGNKRKTSIVLIPVVALAVSSLCMTSAFAHHPGGLSCKGSYNHHETTVSCQTARHAVPNSAAWDLPAEQGYQPHPTHPGSWLYVAEQAEPVTALTAGTVVEVVDLSTSSDLSKDYSSKGNYVVVQDADQNQHIYCTLGEISVTVGDNVLRGDCLGTTGNSGLAYHDHQCVYYLR